MIDLTILRDEVVEAAIHWATTNKDYMVLRDKYVEELEAFNDLRDNRKNRRIVRLLGPLTAAYVLKLTAPSLTKAQQRKLSIVLNRISAIVPDLYPDDSPPPKPGATKEQQNTNPQNE